MDYLCCAPGAYALAQQGGWKLAPATHLRASGSAPAAVVTGRNTNRLYGASAGKAVEDFCDLRPGRHTAGVNLGRPQRRRSYLDASGTVHHLWSHAVVGVWNIVGSEHKSCRLANFQHFRCCRFEKLIQPSLFSGWAIYRSPFRRLDQTHALRFQDAEMVPTGPGDRK